MNPRRTNHQRASTYSYLSSSTIVVRKVASVQQSTTKSQRMRKIVARPSINLQLYLPLTHELRYDTMKCASLVAKTLLSSTQRTKVFRSLWYSIGSEFKCDATNIISANFHIKVDCKK